MRDSEWTLLLESSEMDSSLFAFAKKDFFRTTVCGDSAPWHVPQRSSSTSPPRGCTGVAKGQGGASHEKTGRVYGLPAAIRLLRSTMCWM